MGGGGGESREEELGRVRCSARWTRKSTVFTAKFASIHKNHGLGVSVSPKSVRGEEGIYYTEHEHHVCLGKMLGISKTVLKCHNHVWGYRKSGRRLGRKRDRRSCSAWPINRSTSLGWILPAKLRVLEWRPRTLEAGQRTLKKINTVGQKFCAMDAPSLARTDMNLNLDQTAAELRSGSKPASLRK